MSVFVRQHIQLENDIYHIYISPLALLDLNQTTLVSDPITTRTTIIIPLILYIDEQMKFVLENNRNECKQTTKKCLFYQVSIETMHIIYKDTWDQRNLLHSYRQDITSIQLSFIPLLQQRLLYVNIGCVSKEICLKLNEILHQSKRSLGLYLEYSFDKTEQTEMIINYKHLQTKNIHHSKFVLEYDVEQLLQNLLDVAGIHNNDTYVLSQTDLFSLKETLRKELFGKTLILTDDNDEKQWNSVYWIDENILRPDRVLKLLKKKSNSNYTLNKMFTYENDSNTQMDIYVQQMYDQRSLNLYRKYRHLFELQQTKEQMMLKLKPILAYEINLFNKSKFFIRQLVHLTKRDTIYSMPLCPIASIKETTLTNYKKQISDILQKFRQTPEKLWKALSDWIANKYPSTTTVDTSETTTIETTEYIDSTTDLSTYEPTSSVIIMTDTSDATTQTTTTTTTTTTTLLLRGNSMVEEGEVLMVKCSQSPVVVVVSAIYRSVSEPLSCSQDVTNITRESCFGKNFCDFFVWNDTATGPLPCTEDPKQLEVVYSCDTDRYIFGPVLSNQDSWGEDIYQNAHGYISDVESIEVCGKYCLETDQCVGVVYAPITRHCWLKHTMVTRNVADDRDSMVVIHPDRYPVIDNSE
ncbi:hypothetical protein I4U23_004624 [Adineta vaga]|nr:hypothetical protein I4U23_004624 [Adineta vaga]